jgi:hypothetical protein
VIPWFQSLLLTNGSTRGRYTVVDLMTKRLLDVRAVFGRLDKVGRLCKLGIQLTRGILKAPGFKP